MTEPAKLKVYYDGECPICRHEIGMYGRMRGGERIDWLDASKMIDADLGPDLSKQDALGKFHVRQPDGTLLSGGRAFAEIWARLPALRWAGRLGRTRIGVWVLERAYRIFLRILPWLRRRMGAPERA